MARRSNEASEPDPDAVPGAPPVPARRRSEPSADTAEGPDAAHSPPTSADNGAETTAPAPVASPGATPGGELRERRIGLIGAGALGEALCRGLIQAGAVTANRILVSDVRSEAVQALREALGIRAAESSIQVARYTDLILLVVPGTAVLGVLEEIAESLKRDAGKPTPVLISLAEGVPLSELEARLKEPIPLVRALTCLPIQIGRGVSLTCGGSHAEASHQALADALFRAVGTVQAGPETLLDTVSALICGGPAPLFLLMEALIEAAALAGVSREMARSLVAQSMAGVAQMLLETHQHPAQLRDLCAPPGGSAVNVIADLERAGVRGALIEAFSRAMPPLRSRFH